MLTSTQEKPKIVSSSKPTVVRRSDKETIKVKLGQAIKADEVLRDVIIEVLDRLEVLERRAV